MNDLFLGRYPHLDLHGYDRDYARMLTDDFILENIMLGNDTVVIIHGHGEGIVRNSVYDALNHNKNVIDYKINMFNDGETIIYLKK